MDKNWSWQFTANDGIVIRVSIGCRLNAGAQIEAMRGGVADLLFSGVQRACKIIVMGPSL